MLNKTAITSLDDFREWWEIDETRPFWTLFRGTRKTSATDVIARNDTVEDPEESWTLLERMITINSQEGGEFTILRTDKPRGNHGNKALIVLSHAPAGQLAQVGSLNNMPFIGANNQVQAYIDKEVEKARETITLQNKLESLEAAINAKNEGGLLERMFTKLLEGDKLPTILELILVKILNPTGMPQQPSQVSVSGIPTGETGQFEYDSERILLALERIRVVFPDIHETLEQLAGYIEKNPGTAKTIFSTLK